MNFDELKFWLQVANIIGTALLGAFVFLAKRGDDTGARVSAVEARLIKVEAQLEHMPTHNEITKLGNDLTRLQGENNTQTELLKRMENQMRLINEWMMENK